VLEGDANKQKPTLFKLNTRLKPVTTLVGKILQKNCDHFSVGALYKFLDVDIFIDNKVTVIDAFTMQILKPIVV
jgi:hypothetical protein